MSRLRKQVLVARRVTATRADDLELGSASGVRCGSPHLRRTRGDLARTRSTGGQASRRGCRRNLTPMAARESGPAAVRRSATSLVTSSSPVCPSASAKPASSMSGQPGPSSRDVTSQAASCLGSGGAARQARAYRAVSIRRSPPMMPGESSICSIAAVTRSTARRASGTASAAPPDSIMSAIAPATSRARPEETGVRALERRMVRQPLRAFRIDMAGQQLVPRVESAL